LSALALASDVDIGSVVLQIAGQQRTANGTRVEDRVIDGSIERTIDGASTLTLALDDTDRELIRSTLFDQQIDLRFDEQWWRLVKVSKSGDQLSLVFEDRAISYLRAITTPRKAARAQMTRAEFALSIVREVKKGGGIAFVCPDLHTVQKIATASDATSASARAANVQPGLSADAKLTVKGAPATKLQKQNAERVLDVATSLSAPDRATLALMEAVIVESSIQNLPGGDADSRGILQVRDSTAGPMGISNRDIEACCNAFLSRGFTGRGGAIVLAAKNPSWTAGQIAQAVQGSAFPARYDQAQHDAIAFVTAYSGIAPGTTALTSTSTPRPPYQFQRGGSAGTIENSWDCLRRLAREVQWECFAADGVIYFVADSTLIRQKPIATLSEWVDGVDVIDFDVDNGKTKSDATVTARAARWALPPGSCVVLADSGPANGRWLVSDIQRGIFDENSTITLKRATKPLPEPLTDSTSSSTPTGLVPSGTTGDVAKAYAAAQAMTAKRYPYVWGGGHAHVGTADGGVAGGPGGGIGLIGYDCSGSTCAILAAGRMGFKNGAPAEVSAALMNWGEPGEGQTMTIWASPIHVWIEFKTSAGDQHFGTGDWGSVSGAGGPSFQTRMHTKGGFTARHWKGT
jgi:hypothetical protein